MVLNTEQEYNGSSEKYLSNLINGAQDAANNIVRKTRAYRIKKRKTS